MTDHEKCKKIGLKCRSILDEELPFYFKYDLTDQEKDYAIDYLLRAILGFAERETDTERYGDHFKYIEEKFYSACKIINEQYRRA
ncbi:hypothetical protein [Halobacillus yeomjeoni]|uniref:Uncharacterized protein n=1 Tax=Halobacillus yeomjeoni TaxID=311194 RepID=A0A931MV67_9BACI|nr:hypothetical protein [Halobacillus yeomjeoni]MBH0230071.1 hypothetical protein [Halobacillus yeomjeoni]